MKCCAIAKDKNGAIKGKVLCTIRREKKKDCGEEKRECGTLIMQLLMLRALQSKLETSE